MTVEKRCPRCERTLPLEGFARDRSSRDGRYRLCFECDRKAQRESRDRKRLGGGQTPAPTTPTRHRNFDPVYSRLKDFQRATVEYVFRRLYLDEDCTSRFLVADEVGLGKTLVAQGVIARTIEHLRGEVERIDVVYVCSNTDIARQNIRRLNVTEQDDFALAERITLLPLRLHLITGPAGRPRNLNFVSFTPGTSLDLKSSTGMAAERALLFRMLRDVWGGNLLRRAGGAFHLLRGGCSEGSFRWWLDEVGRQPLDPLLARAFTKEIANTDLRDRFAELARRFRGGHPRADDRIAQRFLVGELREMLARSCVDALEPDLIILDEFQRFRRLLDASNPAGELAQQLFRFRDHRGEPARVLLLSATPYKMYTLAEESDEAHYEDFLATLRFLMEDTPGAIESFAGELDEFRDAVRLIGHDGTARARAARERVEKTLRKVMVRTERLALTDDRSGMLVQAPSRDMRLEADDLQSYLAVERLASRLDAGEMLEYWKSAPYLPNFMDGYKLTRRLERAEERGTLDVPSETTLAWSRVRDYKPIESANPRLRSLIEETVTQGMWRLLWMPPSFRYHRLGEPFSSVPAEALTKRLVFSSWSVVPKAIAALVSYEAERRMVRSSSRRSNTTEARERVRSPLAVTVRDGRPVGMTVFALMYPSPALAMLADPLTLGRELGSIDEPALGDLIAEARRRADHALTDLVLERPTEGPVDERWYWAAPIMLDKGPASAWLRRPGAAAAWTGPDTGGDDTGWSAHLAEAVALPEALGRMPDDLPDLLARLALAAPGVTALRALARVAEGGAGVDDQALRDGAARIAWGLRSLFSTREVVPLLRAPRTLGLPQSAGAGVYWRRVLDYCLNGLLQAVLDEYAHVLVDWLGLLDRSPAVLAPRVSEAMYETAALRTPAYIVRDFRREGSRTVSDRARMRGGFALRYGDERTEDGRETRSRLVWQAFNSPFWPFILATTSVGQEGLDFHLYSHAVVHWNLPANPVDLEQREGRVHRYKGHAVRKNLALAYRAAAFQNDGGDPWAALFAAGVAGRRPEDNDLVPGWVFAPEGGARIERHVPALPLSRERARIEQLQRSVAAYRLAFGQPRQEDLIAYLATELTDDQLRDAVETCRIDLAPPPPSRTGVMEPPPAASPERSAMTSEDMRTFHDDDEGYEAWVGQHGGYVLIDRGKNGFMLHISECSHLGRETIAIRLTERPRRWAAKRQTLIDWAVSETGERPKYCSSCM